VNDKTFESYRVSCTTATNIHELTISMLDGLTNVILQFTVDEKNTTSLSEAVVYVTLNNKQTYFPDYRADLEGRFNFEVNF
jgi:hypothetical protein